MFSMPFSNYAETVFNVGRREKMPTRRHAIVTPKRHHSDQTEHVSTEHTCRGPQVSCGDDAPLEDSSGR